MRATQEDEHVADPRPDGDMDDDSDVRPGGDMPHATPRWVKVFGIIFVVLVLLFIILHLTGNGLGGHSMHRP